MTIFLLIGDFIDVKKDAGFFNRAKLMIDGGAKNAHCGRQVHVGIHQGGNVDAMLANKGVEFDVIVFKIVAYEKMMKLVFVEL